MKSIVKTFALLITALSLYFPLKAQEQKEVLLIGTFHFSNPNVDAIKTDAFNVLGSKPQQELENITDKIKAFGPDKIFIEWEYDKQAELDSLYQLYINGTYNKYINSKYKGTNQYAMYNEFEGFQLAFRAGKKAGLKNIYGIDYPFDLPFDSVMTAMQAAKQTTLIKEIDSMFKAAGKVENLKRKTMGLTDLILDKNTEESRRENAGFYLQMLNKAGAKNNFAGAYLVSEWYRRNLYMYSLIQKITQSTDKKIAILLGSGHIAMLKQFIDVEGKFKVVELKEVLK
nr:DUF5694 domain-containing protein [Pedobacter sp. ASV2]